MAVLETFINVNMNVHSNIHSQLTKSLEKILEDAFLSGELKLSGRKLREFPKPVKFDLSDTVVADLSKNQFTELPEEVTTYAYLEKLLLSQNVIKHVPDAVGCLQSLTFLDLSSNHLTELPREICQMPLQILLVNDNMLTSLPKEIGRMSTLAELDASNNRLTHVPMTLGDCGGLRALNLSNNQLGLLPLQITYLRLEHLDISCNCISSLPLELRNMSSLVILRLDNNPLVSPPTTLCMRGRVHIFKYLENMANKDTLANHKRIEETKKATKHSSFLSGNGNYHISSGNATIDCLRHRQRHAVDSGYSTDGVDRRWSNEGGGGEPCSGRSTPSTPSTISPGAALSRTQSLSSETPLAPLTPVLTGVRISPEGNELNGDDKNKLNHQQTYRQYKEALRQQRQQDIYRPRPESSPDDSSPQNQSPVHLPKSQSSQSPINGYTNTSNTSPSLNKTVSSNSSYNSISPNTSQVPNSPLLHSTPRRTQIQNGVAEEVKRPVQKVVPSRNVKYSSPNEVNGRVNGDSYIKPTSPTKSPTHNGLKSSFSKEHPKLTSSYVKGAKPKISWNKELAPEKLSFTMKREFDKQKEETDLLLQLRTIIESRLKMRLPEQLSTVLSDGVVLCHLANAVRPRSVGSVHVPSPAQPKLTMARCRRNVDNFLEACRRIGVEEEVICSPEDILAPEPEQDEENLERIAFTVIALAHATPPSPKDLNQTEFSYEEDSCYSTMLEDRSHIYRRNEDKYVSNFNYAHETHQEIFDETEEFQLTPENNNLQYIENIHYIAREVQKSNAEFVAKESYSTCNKVQFVMPFYKIGGDLYGDSLEVYDTVDSPVIEETARYDRDKMNLNIKHNLNKELNKTTEANEENRVLFTSLCLGAFFLSVIILYYFPL